MHRGALDGNNQITDANAAYRQHWLLDATGNWSGFQTDANGNNSFADAADLDQARTSNKANEITAISETSGQLAWIDPVYDRAGNMTTIPKPAALNTGLTGIYDAWNRLVEVKDGATTIQKNIFDGLNRRILVHIDSQAPASPNGIDRYEHNFFNTSWQLLETRNTTTLTDQPENIQPKYQWLWSPRYIDAPILRDENTDSDGLCDDGRIYFLTDANMNVTTLTDINGDAIERYLYDAYGSVTIYDGTWTNVPTASSYGNVVMFGGYQHNSTTGLFEIRHRVYSTVVHWAQLDPAPESDGSANRRSYADGNPIGSTDPYGLFAIPGMMVHQSPDSGCCCCCAENVRFGKITELEWGTRIRVDVTFRLLNEPGGDCSLSWYERANILPVAYERLGLKPNEWINTRDFALFRASGAFMEWGQRPTHCPGVYTVPVTDKAYFDPTNRGTRVFHVAVVIQSGKGCPCAFRSITVYGTQTIASDGRGGIKRPTFREGVPLAGPNDPVPVGE
jgi:RHS repeat-associated protein